MMNQPPDNVLFNLLQLTYKSNNIEMAFQQFKSKYSPIAIRYIIILQLTMLICAFIYVLITNTEDYQTYLCLPFIIIFMISLFLLNKYFKAIRVIVQINSIISMIFLIEIVFDENGSITHSTPLILCLFAYVSIAGKSFSWVMRSILTLTFSFYFFYRTNQLNSRPGIILYIFCNSLMSYLEDKENRLKYYDLYRENKINENFQNLIKNIIPCGLFVCSKQVQQDDINNSPDIDKKNDGLRQIKLSNKSIQYHTKITAGSNKDTSVQSSPSTPLQINFANRQCMEDLGITNSSIITQKINNFKSLSKYQSMSQIPNFEKNQKSKFTTTNQDIFENKKENTLNQIIHEYLNTPVKDMIQNIELNNKPEEIYLNVPYENGFTNTKYFDIKLVNCLWDNTEACLCVLINISQKVINQRQNRLEEFQQKMMSTITHNLKTPLNGIILLLQCLMHQQYQMSEDIYSKISDIYTNSELLLCMINDVIDYTKIQSGIFKMSPQKFKINKLLHEIKDLYNTQLQKKQLQFILEYESLCGYTFDTDYQRLKQVLINLTGNALKFTFEGSIKISIKETNVDPNIIEIEVADTGNGISKHIKQSLLHQSKHENEKEKLDKQSGSGIGLNICQCLVDKLGPHSKLFIQSVEKQGTKISFYLYRNLNRKRMASFQNENIRKIYKKQLSLKSQYISFNTNKTDFNYSIDEHQSPQINKTNQKISLTNQGSNRNIQQRDRKDSFGFSLHKTQQLITNEQPISSNMSEKYSHEQGRLRKISIFKEQILNDEDEKEELDHLKEQIKQSQIVNDEDNHLANQNLKEFRKYDTIKNNLEDEQISNKDNQKISIINQLENRRLTQNIKHTRRLTQSKTLPIDNDQEIEEFYQNNKNQVKDDYTSLKSQKKINNIYRMPSKSHRLSELDCISQESPQLRIFSDDSANHLFSHGNIESIRGVQYNSLTSPLIEQKTPINSIGSFQVKKPQIKQLQNIIELGQFDEDSLQNQQSNRQIQLPQQIYNNLHKRYQANNFSDRFNFNTDIQNEIYEKSNYNNDINQIGSPSSIYSVVNGINYGTKDLIETNEQKQEQNDYKSEFNDFCNSEGNYKSTEHNLITNRERNNSTSSQDKQEQYIDLLNTQKDQDLMSPYNTDRPLNEQDHLQIKNLNQNTALSEQIKQKDQNQILMTSESKDDYKASTLTELSYGRNIKNNQYNFKSNINTLSLHNKQIEIPKLFRESQVEQNHMTKISDCSINMNQASINFNQQIHKTSQEFITSIIQVPKLNSKDDIQEDVILGKQTKATSPRNREQSISDRLQLRQRSISNNINIQRYDKLTNYLHPESMVKQGGQLKMTKALSTTFQDGSKEQNSNKLVTNFTKINIFPSEQSMKSGENNKDEDDLNSREGFKQFLGNNLQNKTQSFNPLSSNLSNSNVKGDDNYTSYIRTALENKKILIVDDTMFNVIALKALLQNISQNKIHIDEAYNGRQAMQKVLQSEQLYDLIFMDVNMPVMDGLQATENIKQINRANKIIIVTAFSDETDRTECQNRGADGFLTKPVKIKDLATQIQNVIKLYSHTPLSPDFKHVNSKTKNNEIKENLLQSIKLTRISVDKSKNEIII